MFQQVEALVTHADLQVALCLMVVQVFPFDQQLGKDIADNITGLFVVAQQCTCRKQQTVTMPFVQRLYLVRRQSVHLYIVQVKLRNVNLRESI